MHEEPAVILPPSPPASTPAEPDRPAPLRPVATALIVLLACAVLAIHAWRYMPFFADDALISLRYAERFIEGKGLTWNDGERVEGYSNLLWILLVSGLGKLGMDLVLAARVLGCLATGAVLAAVAASCPPRRDRPLGRAILPAATSTLAVALAGPVAVWAIGGLEQTLMAALVAWGAVLLMPLYQGLALKPGRLVAGGTLWGLAVITRPDGALFAAVGAATLIAVRRFDRRAWKQAAMVVLIPALFYAGQLAFRLLYYNDWLPNPAYAKLAFRWPRLQQGLTYVTDGLWGLWPLVLLACWGAAAGLWQKRTRGPAALLALLTLVLLAYVAAVGGDIFPGWRHLLVVVALMALLAGWGIRRLTEFRGGPYLAAAVAAVALTVLASLQYHDSENRRAIEERWEWDGQVVGEFLQKAFAARNPLLAVDPAGCLPYYSRLPSIDMLGINDRHIARHPPASFGLGWLGHELGDGKYVLARQPDLVLFTSPTGTLTPGFPGARQMMADPAFLDDYQPVLFQCGRRGTTRVTSLIFVRREGRVGIRREAGRIAVPGYFLSPRPQSAVPVRVGPSRKRAVAVGKSATDADGQCDGLLPPRTDCFLRNVSVPEGRWKIRLQPQIAGARILCSAASPAPGVAPDECLVDVPAGGTPLDLIVTAAADSEQHVRDLVLEKQ